MFWILSIVAVACSLPLDKELNNPKTIQKDGTYAYAVDLSAPTSANQMSCLKQQGYQAVFVRAYNPAGDGYFDTNSINNIQNAHSAGLGIEVYMTPQPKSSKQGYQQFDEVYQGLTGKMINVRSIWIQVTSPNNWYPGTGANVIFINSIVSRARQYGLKIGVYTSFYDWAQITKSWSSAGSDVRLWYWNVYGGGVSGESPADFSDFRAFGSWATPAVKQFAQTETVCQMTINKDIFLNSASSSSSGNIVAGLI